MVSILVCLCGAASMTTSIFILQGTPDLWMWSMNQHWVAKKNKTLANVFFLTNEHETLLNYPAIFHGLFAGTSITQMVSMTLNVAFAILFPLSTFKVPNYFSQKLNFIIYFWPSRVYMLYIYIYIYFWFYFLLNIDDHTIGKISEGWNNF